MLKIVIIVLILFSIIPKALCYKYTIAVPTLKCTKGKVDDGTTDISITGDDAFALKYEWAVNFTVKNNCTSQRCTLMAWRSIQELYRTLNYAANHTAIKVNNRMFLSTLQYKINVTTKANGTVVESKEFIWECDEVSKDKLHTIVKLLGPNITYRDLTYTINALVTNYDNPYYFRWSILDQSEKLVKTDLTKGSMLSFRSNALATNHEYMIRCSVIDSEHGQLIAMSTHELTIASRGMRLNLPVKQLHVGVNRAFKLNAYFEDVDNFKGEVNFQWTCHDEQNKVCPNFQSTNSTHLDDFKLSALGRYKMQILAEKNGERIVSAVDIFVIRDGYMSIEVDDFSSPVDPSKEIVVPVYVSSLMAGCSLKWSCLKIPGYDYVDLNKAPGGVAMQSNVTAKYNDMLSEIDEYSNETFDKHYNLFLSAPLDSWTGLGSNKTYMFRLNVTCPVPDNSDTNVEQVLKHVTLTADISLSTSPIPVLGEITVTPNNGVALITNFYFNSSDSLDTNRGVTYFYKFGYFVNNKAVFLTNILNEKSWSSVLPYIDKGVKTVLECCNSYAMCSQVKGPNVVTSLTTFTEEQKSNFQLEIKLTMEREEYYKAFAQATSVLLTYKGLREQDLVAAFENFTNALAIYETKRLIELSNSGNEASKASGDNFIRDVGIILDQISSDELFNAVVSLRNKLSKERDMDYLSKLDYKSGINDANYHNQLRPVIRRKRHIDVIGSITINEVKSYITISELVITSSHDKKKVEQEKEHLVNQVDKFMVQLCGAIYERFETINLDMKTVSLALEKLNKNNINRYFNIHRPPNVNGRIKFGRCLIENGSNQLCIGKAIYKDYFNKSSYVYMIKIYGTKHSEQVKIRDLSCEVVLVLPTEKEDSWDSETKCAAWGNKWDQSKCKSLQVSPKTIQCQCDHLGYFVLEHNSMLSTTIVIATDTPKIQKNTVSTKNIDTTISRESTQSSQVTREVVMTVPVSTATQTTITTKDTTHAKGVTRPTFTSKSSSQSATEAIVVTKSMTTEMVTFQRPTQEKTTQGTTQELFTSQSPTQEPFITQSTTQETVTFQTTTQSTIQEITLHSTESTITTTIPPIVTDSTNAPKPTWTSAKNKTEIQVENLMAEVGYETVCYVIIGLSVVGTGTLLYGIKRIISTNSEVKNDSDIPRYEPLQDEELLDDFSALSKSASC